MALEPLECERVKLRLWEYLDHELGPEEARAVRAHLKWCKHCFPAYCCNLAFLDLVGRQRAKCSATAGLRASILRWLRGED
jgi:anti-sigma factor (TIGR02949 family)